MREMIKMVVILTVLSSVSGGLLASLRDATKERIEGQVLEFVQGPAIRKIMKGIDNDPVADRFTLKINGADTNFFIGKVDGKPRYIALEAKATGFGGDVGMMVAIDMKTDKIVGVSATTHNETPGLGARVATDTDFTSQFAGLPADQQFKVTKDGGSINALSGATITSRAVCEAVHKAGLLYEKNKQKIKQEIGKAG